jgi:3-hydroxyacyl-[acyl-carrier-protein] dehydratase
MRFHLIDRIEEICYGKYITAVKCITLADDVFDEHFPGYPVFPGTLILESLAQLAGSFFELQASKEGLVIKRSILSIVNKFKLRKPALPGDKIMLRADMITRREDFGVMLVKAEIDGQICAEGELTFTFLDIQSKTLEESRKQLYDICMKSTREVF